MKQYTQLDSKPQRLAAGKHITIALTGQVYELPTIGKVVSTEGQPCPCIPASCWCLGMCPFFFFVEIAYWVVRTCVKLFNVLWAFKIMVIDVPFSIRESNYLMLNGLSTTNGNAPFVNIYMASINAVPWALVRAIVQFGRDIVCSLLDLLHTILEVLTGTRLAKTRIHENSLHVGQLVMSMPTVQSRETHPLQLSFGYLPYIPTKQMARRHAFGFTGAYPVRAWTNKKFSEAVHNMVNHWKFEQWNLQTIAKYIRNPSVLKVCLSYQHRTCKPLNEKGDISLKIPVEEWINVTKHIANKAARAGFSIMMIWWDQIFCGRVKLEDLESSENDLATHCLEPYITYPVATMEPVTVQLPNARPIENAPNQNGEKNGNETSGALSTEERMWTSVEMIGGMIGMGLAGATEQADQMLNQDSHNGAALLWRKLKEETGGDFTLRPKDEDDPFYEFGFFGMRLVQDNAVVALAAVAIKTGKFYKSTSSKGDAQALFSWAKNVVFSTTIGLNSKTGVNYEQRQYECPNATFTKAVALMETVGNTNMEMLWQLEEDGNSTACFQPKWDALKSLHWPEEGFALERIADKSGHVVIFDVGAATMKAIASYPRGSKVVIAMWQSGIEGISSRSMQLYMTILKDAWENPWLPKEGLIILKRLGTPCDELEVIRPCEIYSWLQSRQFWGNFAAKFRRLQQHMLEMVNAAVINEVAETSLWSQTSNVEERTLGNKIEVITIGDASKLCKDW